jgi:tight adherence protein B
MSSLIRERFRVRRQVRALSAHGRITGLVLSLLPGVLAGVLFLVVPDHMTPLIEDPLGIRLVVIAIVLQILGVFTIRQIVNIEY